VHLLANAPNDIANIPAARIEIADAIAESAMSSKFYYDRKHMRVELQVGEMAFIRLHKGYNIPAAHRKLGQQRVGPFEVVKKVRRLAYQLDIPRHWRMHPVFSIAHLEPAPLGKDPFERPLPEQPDSVYVDGDDEFNKSYEIERILQKRITQTGLIRYLIRWTGYGPEFDEWRLESQLSNARDLINAFENELKAKREEMSQQSKKGGRGRPRKE